MNAPDDVPPVDQRPATDGHERQGREGTRPPPRRCGELLAYLLAQYDHLVDAHALVVMDTRQDRRQHARMVAAARQAAEPVRQFLNAPATNRGIDHREAATEAPSTP